MASITQETNYLIEYGIFRGPIKVLLELIQKKRVDIYQIELSVIIRDFLKHIKEKKDILLDTISGFLYIASILLEIKSKSIIPSRSSKENDDDEKEDIDILRRREKEYRVYKRIAGYINNLYEQEKLYFVREAPVEKKFLELFPNFLKNISLKDIYIYASKLLRKKQEKLEINYIYTNATITVFDEMKRISRFLKNKDSVTFKQLTVNYTRLIDKIICFLSILELYKKEIIDIIQFESFGNIIIKKVYGT